MLCGKTRMAGRNLVRDFFPLGNSVDQGLVAFSAGACRHSQPVHGCTSTTRLNLYTATPNYDERQYSARRTMLC